MSVAEYWTFSQCTNLLTTSMMCVLLNINFSTTYTFFSNDLTTTTCNCCALSYVFNYLQYSFVRCRRWFPQHTFFVCCDK